MPKGNPGYGDFGSAAKTYAEARREFPEEVMAYFWSLMKVRNPKILDVGCGTGISTRQLARHMTPVSGLDRDSEMIRQAEKEDKGDIRYFVSPVDKMPFEAGVFDGVTAFSAFHWFTDEESMGEIKRVMKNDGVFFAVNRNESSLVKDYRRMIGKFIAGDAPDIKRDYDPSRILKSNGFAEVSTVRFKKTELWSLSQATAYPQTMSLWNLVPENKKHEALLDIEKCCRLGLKDGFMKNELEFAAVSGIMRKDLV